MPVLSIITINYNNARGLQKTMDSVLHQRFSNYEYIVIDGGSSDGSKQIIEQHKSKLTYWVSEADKGIYNAMNKGIKQANGDYLLFLNSGDYLTDKDILTKVFASKLNADIAYGNMLIEKADGTLQQGYMPSKITLKQMVVDTLWHPVSFIKKSLFDKYGLYNEDYKIVADYDFFFKTIIKNAVSTQYLNLTISVYNLTGLSSLPENKAKEQAERKKVMESYLSPELLQVAEKYRHELTIKPSLLKRILNRLKK